MSEILDTYACEICTYVQSMDVLKCEMVSSSLMFVLKLISECLV
jgi:hypothetical protein